MTALTVSGKFATFVADPPWRYGNTSTRGAAEPTDEELWPRRPR